MKTIVIPQFYRGPSGQKGLYNRQEVGLARAYAALGCRAVVLYPAVSEAAPQVEQPLAQQVGECLRRTQSAQFAAQFFQKSFFVPHSQSSQSRSNVQCATPSRGS